MKEKSTYDFSGLILDHCLAQKMIKNYENFGKFEKRRILMNLGKPREILSVNKNTYFRLENVSGEDLNIKISRADFAKHCQN